MVGLYLFPSLFFGRQAGLTVEPALASWLQFHEEKKRGVIHWTVEHTLP